MPTIGVGKAFRDQDREAARRRAESRRRYDNMRSRRSGEVHIQMPKATCEDCGQRTPMDRMVTTASGMRCDDCDVQHTLDVTTPDWTSDARATLGWAALVFLGGIGLLGASNAALVAWLQLSVPALAIYAALRIRRTWRLRNALEGLATDASQTLLFMVCVGGGLLAGLGVLLDLATWL